MHDLPSLIPDIHTLAELAPQELGLLVLPLLAGRTSTGGRISIHNELNSINANYNNSPLYSDPETASRIIAEAMHWLVQGGMLVPDFSQYGSWFWVSRKGRRAVEASSGSAPMERMLSPDLLHPTIRENAWRAFVRRAFDTAVFESMKAVEVALREAAGLGQDLLGVKLARAAFGDRGPLTDMDAEGGGAAGAYGALCGCAGLLQKPAITSPCRTERSYRSNGANPAGEPLVEDHRRPNGPEQQVNCFGTIPGLSIPNRDFRSSLVPAVSVGLGS